MNVLGVLFHKQKPIIGMIHSLPLPGSPKFRNCRMEEVYDYAMREAELLTKGGVDGLLIENAGDIPFVKEEHLGPETAACIAIIGERLKRVTDVPVGVNIVANAAMHSLAATKAFGGKFIRVNQWANAYVANEGFVEGMAGLVLRYRSILQGEDIHIFADVHVKHGSHAITGDRPVEELAQDNEFFEASALIATGFRTGNPTKLEEVQGIRKGSALPVLVGSGINASNCRSLLGAADGAILGVSIKERPSMSAKTDKKKLQAFMEEVERIRAQCLHEGGTP